MHHIDALNNLFFCQRSTPVKGRRSTIANTVNTGQQSPIVGSTPMGRVDLVDGLGWPHRRVGPSCLDVDVIMTSAWRVRWPPTWVHGLHRRWRTAARGSTWSVFPTCIDAQQCVAMHGGVYDLPWRCAAHRWLRLSVRIPKITLFLSFDKMKKTKIR